MPKKTDITYRVVMEIPSEGIERSLPYILESKEEADDLAEILDRALYPRYHHRVETSVSHHMTNGNPKEHTYAYHGR